MQNFWYLLVSLKNLQKEINDQVVFLENFKDNFEKIKLTKPNPIFKIGIN